MLNKIKRELFYIKKLFSQHYGLFSNLNYFKNKIFGSYFLSQLPKYQSQPDPNLELHVICQKSDLGMLEWSLRSFLHNSGLCPQIIIHDDGSIDINTAQKLEKRFSNLKILFRVQADKLIYENQNIPEIIKESRRKGHRVLSQLTDIFILSKSPKVIIADSDVLFFNKLTELTDFVNGRASYDAIISHQPGSYDLEMDDFYVKKYNLSQAGFMNPGLIAYNKNSLKLEKLVEFFEHHRRDPYDFFLPMAGWGCLISQINYQFFPADKYIMKGRPDANTIMKHFTGPRRYDLCVYGIDMVRTKMNK